MDLLSCSSRRRSKLQCSARRDTIKIRTDNVLTSTGLICWATGRVMACCRRAVYEDYQQNCPVETVGENVPLHDLTSATKRKKSCVMHWTTVHRHATVSCKACGKSENNTTGPKKDLTWTPPADDGLMIIGCNADCSSFPNLVAVFGIWGTHALKILSR